MPVAVMADNPVSFQSLLEQCEEQELEKPRGTLTGLRYSSCVLSALHKENKYPNQGPSGSQAKFLCSAVLKGSYPEKAGFLAPGGVATPQVYSQLLVLYLLHNDTNNARYLWKRIPPAAKSSCPEIGWIWEVGQKIWQRDFPGIYSSVAAHQWSESIQPIIEAVRDATRQRAFSLVSQAYTSISADDFAAFVGLPVEEAVKGVVEQGWQADSATRIVMPKKPDSAPLSLIPNEQQLARLTDYVAFLEN